MMTIDEIHRLRTAATAVAEPTPARGALTARQAARAISGVVMLMANQHGMDVARTACANLATSTDAWSQHGPGPLGDALRQIAIVSRGIAAVSGMPHMQSALAFWATETDAATCQRVQAGLAA